MKVRKKNFYDNRRKFHYPVEKPVQKPDTEAKLQRVLAEYRKITEDERACSPRLG